MSTKTALVTGSSEGGIGAAIVRALSAQGYHVYAAVRTPAKAASLKSISVEVVTLDVTDRASIEKCAAYVSEQTGGKLDVLVNNAGGVAAIPLLDHDIEKAKQMYDVNVWGLLSTTQVFAPMLIKSKGVILNISSAAAYCNGAWQGIYSSSKFAVTSISETLKVELSPFGVRVLTAMVGAVKSRIFENGPDTKLPESSYYKSAQDKITQFGVSGPSGVPFEDTDVTAKNLVADIVAGKNGRIHRGAMAGAAWWLNKLLPMSVIDWGLNRDRGVYEVGKAK